jgi:hypothetical protein
MRSVESIPQSAAKLCRAKSNAKSKRHTHRGYAIEWNGTRWIISDLPWGDAHEVHSFKSLKSAKAFISRMIEEGDAADRSAPDAIPVARCEWTPQQLENLGVPQSATFFENGRCAQWSDAQGDHFVDLVAEHRAVHGLDGSAIAWRAGNPDAAVIAEQMRVLDKTMTRFGLKAHLLRQAGNVEQAVEQEQLVFNLYEAIEECRAEYSALTGQEMPFQLMEAWA